MSELTLTIKCSNADKATVSIEASASVLDLKHKIFEQLSVPAVQQRLIYKGRVLKDDVTLDHYEVQDGHTIHMVKGAAPAGAPSSSSPATSAGTIRPPVYSAPPASGAPTGASNNPNPMASLFGNPAAMAGMGGLGGMGGMDMSRMQEQLMQNPEMMQQIMSSPMMENLMNNPDMMRNMMMNNPQMQAMMDQNPQMRHVLNDPAVLRQSMEMMRNPAAMREAMRSQELQMSQLENLPGGFNALRRMYEDVQEPMMEAANAQHQQQAGMGGGGNSSDSSSNNSSSNTNPTNTALPNPWGAPAAGATPGAGPGMSGGGNNPFASMFGAGGGMGGMGGLNGNNAMGGGMDPAQMSAMMQNPIVQQMMANMMNDPATINRMSQMDPRLGAALQNPQVRAMMSDPATIQAAMQMQQAMGGGGGGMPGMFGNNNNINNPNAMGGFGMGNNPQFNPFMMMFPPPATSSSAAADPVGGLNFSSLLGSNAIPAPASGSGSGRPATAPAQAAVEPSVRYASQLQQLQDMGFADTAANLQALIQTRGNANAAVERLLGGGGGGGEGEGGPAATEASGNTASSTVAGASVDGEGGSAEPASEGEAAAEEAVLSTSEAEEDNGGGGGEGSSSG